MVFDGVHPIKKAITHEARRKRYDEDAKAIADMRAEMSSDILNKASMNRLRQLMSRNFGLGRKNLDILREVISATGIPVLEATDESEKLCTMLAIEGFAEGVLSADTDNLAYGCPLLMFEPTDSSERASGFTCVGIRDVLSGLNLTYRQFKDLCIMLGCDYNTNIPQIGYNRAYKLIQQFGSIDNLPRLPKPTLSPSKLVNALAFASSKNSSPASGSPQRIASGETSPKIPPILDEMDKDLLDPEACHCGIPSKPVNGIYREYDIKILSTDYCRKQFSQAMASSLCVNWGVSLNFSKESLQLGRPVFEKNRIENYYSRLLEVGLKIPPASETDYRAPEPVKFCIVES